MSEETKPIYDPRKPYVWEKEQKFEINGSELDILLKALQANFESSVFNAHVLQFEAYQAIQLIIKRNVEGGEIREYVVQEEPTSPSQEVYTDLELKI